MTVLGLTSSAEINPFRVKYCPTLLAIEYIVSTPSNENKLLKIRKHSVLLAQVLDKFLFTTYSTYKMGHLLQSV